MADVHFDTPKTETNEREITAMQGATAIVNTLIEQKRGHFVDSDSKTDTAAVARIIKEVKAALLA